jgi:aspartyl-tRNA(Asn)/glutamyl-tRNA(Gln) amidotransferase subunit B
MARSPTAPVARCSRPCGTAKGQDADAVIEAKGPEADERYRRAGTDHRRGGCRQPDNVAQFKAGKDKAFNALVGQIMKASKGKANPQQVNDLLRKKIG